jgi:large subunit ribosomal protein L1
MAEIQEQLKKGLAELRKLPEATRKFDQSVDLLVNLQKFDAKKTPLNLFISVPHKIKDKRIGAFLDIKRKDIDTITLEEFKAYSAKSQIKSLVNKYDFFVAQASLMPKVAATFGRALGPSGKMPSPQLGIMMNVDDRALKELIEKINHSVKIKAKEPSIKVAIGKQSMKDEDIIENIMVVYNALLKSLTKEKDNIKNIEVKFSMTKPIKVNVR